jgi:hypothetical protein
MSNSSKQILVCTKTGFTFGVPIDALERALAAEKCSLSEAVAKLERMLESLLRNPPVLLEHSGSMLQALALKVAHDARVANLSALQYEGDVQVDRFLDKLVRCSGDQDAAETWINDEVVGDEELCEKLIKQRADIMYALSGQKQIRGQVVTGNLKNMRKKVLSLCETLPEADLVQAAVMWREFSSYIMQC